MAMLILHFLFSLVYRGSETDKIRPESPGLKNLWPVFFNYSFSVYMVTEFFSCIFICMIVAAYCPFITDVPVISSPMFIVRLNVAEDNMTNICFRKEGLHWSKQPRTVQACCKEVLVADIRLANRHAGIVDKEFHIPLFCEKRHGYWLQRLSPNYHSNSQQALRLSISMATMAAFAASWPPAGRAPSTSCALRARRMGGGAAGSPAASPISLRARRIIIGGAATGGCGRRRCWTPAAASTAVETNTRKLADGRVALRRSYSSRMDTARHGEGARLAADVPEAAAGAARNEAATVAAEQPHHRLLLLRRRHRNDSIDDGSISECQQYLWFKEVKRLNPSYHSNSQQALRFSNSKTTGPVAFAAADTAGAACRAPLTFLDMAAGSWRTGLAGCGTAAHWSRRRWQHQQQLWRRRRSSKHWREWPPPAASSCALCTRRTDGAAALRPAGGQGRRARRPASSCALRARRIIIGGATGWRRCCWTPAAVETNTRKLADGRVALRRSYSSRMWASSSSEVTDTSRSSSRPPSARRYLTAVTASPPAPAFSASRAVSSRKGAPRGTARARVSPPTYRRPPPGPHGTRRPPWLQSSLIVVSSAAPISINGWMDGSISERSSRRARRIAGRIYRRAYACARNRRRVVRNPNRIRVLDVDSVGSWVR
uniref:Uncharacterized protein n=1 Tax=Oryza rufipogon TaxID=4529 RepID=A0A0E0NZU5_ORYRU